MSEIAKKQIATAEVCLGSCVGGIILTLISIFFVPEEYLKLLIIVFWFSHSLSIIFEIRSIKKKDRKCVKEEVSE